VERVRVTIDGRQIAVEPGTTIIKAARECGVDIPSLCQDDRLEPFAACRLCLVEVEGARAPLVACATPVTEGMVVTTESDDLAEQRRVLIDLLLSDHRFDCLVCDQAGGCRLQDLAYRYGISDTSYKGERREYPYRDDNPFIAYDPGKCILCGRCVGVCEQVQGCRVLDFAERGFPSLITTSFGRSMVDTDCEQCGNCVSACPTGALQDKRSIGQGRPWDTRVVDTVCPFCGCGCNIQLHVNDGRVVRVTAPAGVGPNQGNLCVKGRYGYQFIGHPERLTEPLVRKAGKLVPATWDEALTLVARKLKGTHDKHGADAVAGFSSARCTNEENYLFQKLMRGVLGTNNVDHCARLCHASTVTGLIQSLGSGAMTNPFDDLAIADAILVIGSNTTEAHPIGALYIKQAVRRGAKLIVADPRRIDLVRFADLHLPLRSGTNAALLNGIAHVIIEEGLADDEFIAARTEGFAEFRKVVEKYTPERVETITGVPAADIVAAARMYGTAAAASLVYSMGITQHSHGTEHVLAVSNLALLTGNLGRPGTGVNPLRGQNNVQGACDMGALPNTLPGYQAVTDAAVLGRFATAWGVEMPPAKVGLTVTEAMDAMLAGELKALYIMGENPMLSDPDIGHVEEALKKLDFLVVQDIFLTETAQLADVVLPAATFAEKDGTFTNTERKVQLVRKAVASPGEARADWKIIADLAQRLGADWPAYRGPRAIMDEVAGLTPSYGGISFDRLDDEGAVAWPAPTADHPGTPTLHIGQFTRGKGRFVAVEYEPPAEEPDAGYPLRLTTGRMLEHYHTGTMTRKSDGLNELVPTGFVELNPADAAELGVADAAEVVVETRRGRITIPAYVTDRVAQGTAFVPFHFWESPANRLTNPARDPQAKIPEFKVCGCRVRPAKKV
jgi:formate dehydrogenase (NADP+) alpha subunit